MFVRLTEDNWYNDDHGNQKQSYDNHGNNRLCPASIVSSRSPKTQNTESF